MFYYITKRKRAPDCTFNKEKHRIRADKAQRQVMQMEPGWHYELNEQTNGSRHGTYLKYSRLDPSKPYSPEAQPKKKGMVSKCSQRNLAGRMVKKFR